MTFDNSNNIVYISLGSNLGDRLNNIVQATKFIEKRIGKIIDKANIYESIPDGFHSNHLFLNTALSCSSSLPVEDIIIILLAIEAELGRTRNSKGHSDRTIDLDFLAYNDLNFTINSDNLILPHPRMLDREFQIIPLIEVAKSKLTRQIEDHLQKDKSIILKTHQMVKLDLHY